MDTEYSLLTLDQLSESAELHPALIEKFIQHGLIERQRTRPLVCYSRSPLLNASGGSFA